MARFKKTIDREKPAEQYKATFTDKEMEEFHEHIEKLKYQYNILEENTKQALKSVEYYWYLQEGAISLRDHLRYPEDHPNEKLRGLPIKNMAIIVDGSGATIKYNRCREKWEAYQNWWYRKNPPKTEEMRKLDELRKTIPENKFGVEPL